MTHSQWNGKKVAFFNNKDVDKLHPNADGHRRMAKAIACQLLAIPSDFKD